MYKRQVEDLSCDELDKIKPIAESIGTYYKNIYPYLFDTNLSAKDKLKESINKSMKSMPTLGGQNLNVGEMLSGLVEQFGGTAAMTSPKTKIKIWNSPAISHRSLSKLLKTHLLPLQESLGESFVSSENLLLHSPKKQDYTFINNDILNIINRIYSFLSLLNNPPLSLLSSPDNFLIKDHIIICDSFIAKLITMIVCEQNYETVNQDIKWNNMSVRLVENLDKGYIFE